MWRRYANRCASRLSPPVVGKDASTGQPWGAEETSHSTKDLPLKVVDGAGALGCFFLCTFHSRRLAAELSSFWDL